MLQSSQDLEQNSFRIKPNNEKFFSKLLSKETSKSNPSFRVYYGDVSSAVPFIWETAPGTPKHTLSEASIPPLTPPPSYYNNSTKKTPKSSKNKHSRSKFLLNFLTRMSFNKVDHHVGSSPSSSSASHSLSSSSFSTSSSLSSFSDPVTTVKDSRGRRSRRRFSSWGSSFDHDYDNYDNHLQQVGGSSRFCFGFRNETGRRSHVKKALI